MAVFFVTGSGTDIGKTWVSCLLIRQAQARGVSVSAFKPVLSGFDPDKAEQSDAGHLLKAMGRPVQPQTLNLVSPMRFRAPLSVDMAARREGKSLDFDDLVQRTHHFVKNTDSGLIEGVGGVMAPLDAEHTVLDWIEVADCPVLLVCGTYLGALSHGLTAYESLKTRGVKVGAVLINESEGSYVDPEETRESFRVVIKQTPLVLVRQEEKKIPCADQPGADQPDLAKLFFGKHLI